VKHNNQKIIAELSQLINDQLKYIDEKIIPLEEEHLVWRPSKYNWNIYEVLEHLIRFGEFYIPKIRQVVSYPKSTKKSDTYRSGTFGEFAIKRTRPVNGVVLNKAKSSSKNNPFLRQLNKSVISEYAAQQKQLLQILSELDGINLSKNYVPTVVGNWLKLNLGDSLRLLIHHEERHFIQINKLVNKEMD